MYVIFLIHKYDIVGTYYLCLIIHIEVFMTVVQYIY